MFNSSVRSFKSWQHASVFCGDNKRSHALSDLIKIYLKVPGSPCRISFQDNKLGCSGNFANRLIQTIYCPDRSVLAASILCLFRTSFKLGLGHPRISLWFLPVGWLTRVRNIGILASAVFYFWCYFFQTPVTFCNQIFKPSSWNNTVGSCIICLVSGLHRASWIWGSAKVHNLV